MTKQDLINKMEDLSDQLYQFGKQVCYENVAGSISYCAGETLKSLSDIIDHLTESLNNEVIREEHNA